MANKTSAVDAANNKIDAAKAEYAAAEARGDKAGMDAAHAKAEAVRNDMASQGYVAGNYVQSSSNSSKNSNVNNSNYTYDAATNYERVYEPVEEEPKIDDRDDLINKYVDASQKAQEAQLLKSYNANLAEIANQEDTAKKVAQTNRNAASVQNQLADQRIARYMANNGLSNSGTNAQAMINSAGNLQNNLSAITSNEQQALDDLAQQRVLAKSNLESDRNAVYNGLQAQALQSQLSRLDAMEQLKAQQDFATQQALQERQWNLEDYNNNTVLYTDPYTGQQLRLSPEAVAELNYNNALLRTQATSGGSSSGGGNSIYDKTLLTEYNKYLNNNGLTIDDLSYSDFVSAISGIPTGIGIGNGEVDGGYIIDPKYLNTGDNTTTTKTTKGEVGASNVLKTAAEKIGESIVNKVADNPLTKVINSLRK